MKLLDELKRRKVFRVALAYVAFAWLMVQVAEALLPAYGFTDAGMRMLVALLATGLVVTLVLAWIFEWTPSGVQVTASAGESPDAGVGKAQRAPNAVIAAIVVLATALAAWLTFRTVDIDVAADNSIAVLPFATLGEADANVFTDGIHVGVISRLSNVADLDVISRTSVLTYRDTDRPLPVIADELRAAWVLNADVQQVNDSVLVSVRLADARADRQVWAQDFQRTLNATNIFEIQSDIAGRIIEEVNATLTLKEKERVTQVPTANLEAYGLYQRGRALLDQRAGESMRNALDYFEKALEQDPDYALAWAGLADGLSLLAGYELDTGPATVIRAQQAVERALALDPELAEAWAARGLLEYLAHDAPGAVAALERAIEYRPSYAHAHTLLAFHHALMGNFESAYTSASRGVRLDPFSSEAHANFSGSSLQMGYFDESLAAAWRCQELAPGWPNTRLVVGLALYGTGDAAGALEQIDGVTMPWTGAGAETLKAKALMALGREAEVRELLTVIEAMGDAYAVATVRATLGERDAGYATLMGIETWDDFPAIAFRSTDRTTWNPDGDDPRYALVTARIDRSWGVGDSP